MPLFSYKAEDRKGGSVHGLVEAVSEESVANLLAEKDLIVVSIKKRGAKSGDFLQSIFKRVKVRDLVVFFRQLSVMIRANLPIVRALNILVRQTKNKQLKMVIASVSDEIDGGARLSDAMATFPNVFGDFYTNVIRSGETSGRLSEVIDYLADQQEKDYDLQSKVKGAMIYPAFIVSALVIVGFIVMTFVIPQMTGMLIEAGVDLPFLTKVLIAVSSFLRQFWFYIIIMVIALVFGLLYLIKKIDWGIRLFDRFKIKVPIFGGIFVRIYIVRITRSFYTLLKGGVPIARSLEVVRDVVGNTVYEDILNQTIKEVDEGNSVSESMAPYKDIPIMVVQMIGVGEETGRLDEVLERMTDFYSREIDASVSNLSTLIEPLIMVVLGVAIGGFITAVIMPMWQLSAAF